jgi:hypothetical protein
MFDCRIDSTGLSFCLGSFFYTPMEKTPSEKDPWMLLHLIKQKTKRKTLYYETEADHTKKKVDMIFFVCVCT